MNFSDLDLSCLPSPLADAVKQLLDEDAKQPFRQVHRLIDTIEVFCKLYTVASVSQLAGLIVELGGQSEQQDRLDEMKAMLCTGLKTPSLGVWWMFARESAKVIDALGKEHILPNGSRVLTHKNSKVKKAFDSDKNLISFRNGYAHGATPSDADCAQDYAQYGQRLISLIEQANELKDAEWIVTDEQGQAYRAQGQEQELIESLTGLLPQRCYLRRAEQMIDLHPLLCYRNDDSDSANGFYFYNDLRSKYASLLNYPEASHIRDTNIKESLLERFPIEQWKKELKRVELNPFRERIEELIEVFKGRREELSTFAEHLTEHSSGFFMIWGPPGVGKSALLARFAELLRWESERREEAYPTIEWPKLEFKLVDYYIRRGSTDKVTDMFDSMNQRLDALYNMNYGLGGDALEKKKLFLERLKGVAEKLEKHQRLILIFDGLDEAPPELIKNLPRTTPEQIPDQIMVFYGSRPQRDLKYNFYDSLEREKRSELTLAGLSVQDTRALLYEHVNKYELETRFVEAVATESEGNPLYLKLLCQGLEQGIYQLNDVEALPKEISNLYENALVRMNQEHPDSGELLCLLAAAKDALTTHLMGILTNHKGSQVESGPLAACYELLTPRTQHRVTSYQLFHESLREHLKEHFKQEVNQHEAALQKWCCDWIDEDGDPKHSHGHARRYAMRYAIPHTLDLISNLGDEKKVNKAEKTRTALLELIDNEAWRRANFETTGSGEAMRLGFTSAQAILMKRHKEEPPVNDIMRYALWYHEEPRRFYEEQRTILRTAPQAGQEAEALERVARMAQMGDTPRVKLLLAISAMWAPASRPAKSSLPEELLEIMEEWFEEARDPNLEDLWELSYVQG